jgi:hypothetical protein
VRNSSLVEGRCAETFTGLSQVPKLETRLFGRVVGEHSLCDEGPSARRTGAQRRENAGMSNRKSAEMADRRKGKVSSAMEISRGLGGT